MHIKFMLHKLISNRAAFGKNLLIYSNVTIENMANRKCQCQLKKVITAVKMFVCWYVQCMCAGWSVDVTVVHSKKNPVFLVFSFNLL